MGTTIYTYSQSSSPGAKCYCQYFEHKHTLLHPYKHIIYFSAKCLSGGSRFGLSAKTESNTSRYDRVPPEQKSLNIIIDAIQSI